MKKTLLILAASLIAMTLAGFVLAADAPAKAIKVTNYGAKDAVTFDHAKHAAQKVECVTCHHNADKGQYKCGDCHKGEATDKTPPIKEAMHSKEKGVCYTCHLKPEAANKKKCADCHAG